MKAPSLGLVAFYDYRCNETSTAPRTSALNVVNKYLLFSHMKRQPPFVVRAATCATLRNSLLGKHGDLCLSQPDTR